MCLIFFVKGLQLTAYQFFISLYCGFQLTDCSVLCLHFCRIKLFSNQNSNLCCIKVECRYNAVQFITIIHRTPHLQQQNINQVSNSQQTPHTLPSRASYWVSIMIILKQKNDRVITAPHCIWITKLYQHGIIGYKLEMKQRCKGTRLLSTWSLMLNKDILLFEAFQ